MKKVQCFMHHDCWRNHEENLSLKAILNWCHENELTSGLQVACEPLGDSTCPDYVLDFKDKKIAIEVVQSQKGFTADDKGNIDKAVEILPAFHKKIDDLKIEIDKWISPQDVIYCELSIFKRMQKKQFKIFFKLLNQELRTLYNSGNFLSNWTSLNAHERDAPKVKVKLCKRNGEGSLVTFLKPSGTSLVPLKADADLVLKICIDSKNEKMKSLLFDEKWLIIVPQHSLLDLKDYKKSNDRCV